MNANALGLIEVIGYPAALEAADTCVKSSHVKLLGYEKALDGRIVVKIMGDVGAVKAALDSAKSSASKLGTVIAAIVIARPAEGITALIHSPETVFADIGDTLTLQEESNQSALPDHNENNTEAEATPVYEEFIAEFEDIEITPRKELTCNLCGDPLCTRIKGQPASLCLHYQSPAPKNNKDGLN